MGGSHEWIKTQQLCKFQFLFLGVTFLKVNHFITVVVVVVVVIGGGGGEGIYGVWIPLGVGFKWQFKEKVSFFSPGGYHLAWEDCQFPRKGQFFKMSN